MLFGKGSYLGRAVARMCDSNLKSDYDGRDKDKMLERGVLLLQEVS